MPKTEIDDLAVVVSASTGQLAGDLRAAVRMFEGFQKQVEAAKGETGAAKDAAKEAEVMRKAARLAVAENKRAAKDSKDAWDKSAASRITNFAKETVKGYASAAASIPIAGLAIGAGAVLGVHGLAEAFHELSSAVNMAAELELTTIAFEVMLKSGEKATKMLADIRKFAAETPFNNAELTDASRKLIAYGIAGEQVIPTLRMLGDVSAATQTPISDLAYLYGTLAAQQRAYSRDIFQFANRGIPIYEALAKVLGKSVPEMKDLVEEGKVGFPEVVQAFKYLTEGKGIYAGLTARQADTFAGIREQLSDAMQVGKIKLGKVLIEELGLREAAKDLTKFFENLEDHLDRIRPGVRLVGDLGRSFAQVSYEIGKAAVNGGDFFFQMDRAAFPEMYKFFGEVREFLKSGKDFKLNPRAVNEAIFGVYDGLMELFVETLKGIRSIGEALRNEFIKPLAEGIQFMLRNWVDAKGLMGVATPAERFRPPSAFEKDEDIIKRFRELWSVQVALKREIDTPPGPFADVAKQAQKRVEYVDMELARQKFLGQFAEPPLVAQHKLFVEGKLPAMKDRADVLLGNNGWLTNVINDMEGRRAAAKAVRDRVMAGIHEEEWRKKNEEDAATRARQAADAFAGLAGGAAFAAKELSEIKAPPAVEVPWAIRAEVLDAAKHAKEQHGDPVNDFLEKFNALSEGFLLGEIRPDVYDRAAADLVRRTGQKVGMGPSQLPEAATLGSVESVRILNQWASGQMNMEDFLGQLVEIAKQQLAIDQQLLEKAAVPLLNPIPK